MDNNVPLTESSFLFTVLAVHNVSFRKPFKQYVNFFTDADSTCCDASTFYFFCVQHGTISSNFLVENLGFSKNFPWSCAKIRAYQSTHHAQRSPRKCSGEMLDRHSVRVVESSPI